MNPRLVTREELVGYQRRLRGLGLEIADRIRPGLSPEAIERRMQPLGLRLPDEARVWFAWQGGVDHPELDLEIAPGFVLLSLDDAIATYQQQQPGVAEIWPPAWFPFARAYGILVCDCSVAAGAPTPVRVIDQVNDDLQRPFARSLGEMLDLWNRSWDIGAWSADAPIRMVRNFEQPEPDGVRNLLLDV